MGQKGHHGGYRSFALRVRPTDSRYNANVMELQGKTVLVTGGARHLGRAIALALAERGAGVAFTFLTSLDQAARTESELQRLNPASFALRCDLRDEDGVRGMVEQVRRRLGSIDVLVNNAGLFETAPFEAITAAQWDNLFAVNVRAPFLISKLCAPALRSARGAIINLGSLGGLKPWSTHAHYCSSKAALHMLTQVMAKALAPEVAVNCVAPGMIETGAGGEHGALQDRLAAKTPMKTNGTPADVVSAVLYFATAPRFITGQILAVDGGLGFA